MMNNKISWCFRIKKGLQIDEPNDNLSKSYLDQADKALSKVKSLLDDDDLVWASVRIYYASYYSLYSFMQKIGVNSENHECSISLVKYLLKMDFLADIDKFKDNRIDSQYYLKIGKKDKLEKLYKKAKAFYLRLKDIVLELSTEDIKTYRNKINELR